MLGSRALFAFQAAEKLPDGEPTPEARLGALMEWERQSVEIATLKLLEEFCKAWAKSKGGGVRRR